MPTGPACGWRQGKILGRRGRRAGDGHRNPAMQPGALPERERRAVVAVPSSPHAGPKFGGRDSRCPRRSTAGVVAARKRRAGSRGDHQQSTAFRTEPATATGRHALWPNGRTAAQTAWATRDPARGVPASPPRTSDRPAGAGRASPRPPRRHADRLVRSCALTCDIRIGPSENSPALAFSVRPRK